MSDVRLDLKERAAWEEDVVWVNPNKVVARHALGKIRPPIFDNSPNNLAAKYWREETSTIEDMLAFHSLP